MLVAAGAHRERAGPGADGGAFDEDVVGEVEELEHGRVPLAEAVGPHQGLRVAVRSANHEKRAALGDHAAEEREMRRVVRELVFERQLGAGVLVGRELDQPAALLFELRGGAPGVRIRQHAELAEALRLVQPCLS